MAILFAAACGGVPAGGEAEEQVAEEPVVEEPAAEEPVADEPAAEEPIKIGQMCQLSGGASFLGPSEEAAVLIAVAEINAQGGLLGRQVEAIICDTATDAETANECAKRLINEEHVSALFASTTSASREAVIPVVEQNGETLYFYDAIYEGHSCSPNMWVFGTMPENQIFPVVPYVQDEYGGNKWYFVGDDYNWPQDTAKISKISFEENGSELVGEKYVPIGTTDFTSILQDISEVKPDFVLLVTLPSDAVAFMTQFHSLGLDKDIRVITTLVEESAIAAMGEASEGLLIPVGYHATLETEANIKFLENYFKVLGDDAPVQNFISMHAYDAVRTWALAVEKAGTLDHEKVAEALPTVTWNGPAGELKLDAKTHHAFLPIHLAEVNADGVAVVIHTFGVVDPGQQCDFGD